MEGASLRNRRETEDGEHRHGRDQDRGVDRGRMAETEQEQRLIGRDSQQTHQRQAAEIVAVSHRLKPENPVSDGEHRGRSTHPRQDQDAGRNIPHDQLPHDGETRHQGLNQDQHQVDDAAS